MPRVGSDAQPDGDPAAPAWVREPRVEVRAPLDVTGQATDAIATRGRRDFRVWLALDVLAGELLDDLVLAVYEAMANCVDHAYRHAPEAGPVRLVARRLHEAIHVTVTDHGLWRNSDDADPMRRFRGRGLPMIRVLVPDVHLETGPAGTAVHLRAPLPPPTARRP